MVLVVVVSLVSLLGWWAARWSLTTKLRVLYWILVMTVLVNAAHLVTLVRLHCAGKAKPMPIQPKQSTLACSAAGRA
jgi:hypothetical protein